MKSPDFFQTGRHKDLGDITKQNAHTEGTQDYVVIRALQCDKLTYSNQNPKIGKGLQFLKVALLTNFLCLTFFFAKYT